MGSRGELALASGHRASDKDSGLNPNSLYSWSRGPALRAARSTCQRASRRWKRGFLLFLGSAGESPHGGSIKFKAPISATALNSEFCKGEARSFKQSIELNGRNARWRT